MAYFAYKGRDAGGKLIEGVLEGASAGGVADLLLGRGVTPVSIEETRSKAAGGTAFSLFKPRVEHVDILLFSRQLHTLLKAGVPIMRALNGLQESATNPSMKEVVRDVRESLENGKLVHILQDYRQQANIWAVYAAPLANSAKVRVTVEHLRQYFDERRSET